ncbi:MAG: right-handed parallel beta-helix repeat-containing protein [Chloroflexota bacterium]
MASYHFENKVYIVEEPTVVTGSNQIIDGQGALLVGTDKGGIGLLIENCEHVVIQNFRLRQFKLGIVARNCKHITIRKCDISDTAETPPNTEFLNIWLPASEAIGGGILLEGVTDSTIELNNLEHQMNGLLAFRCQRLTVQQNQANYCSGAGFHLYATCDSRYLNNHADYCSRYYQSADDLQRGHMGADAAGFVIVHDSCRNTFRQNVARMGGDGFFLAGLTNMLLHHPCNDNLFEANDGSYSPNIAFEATFSSGNIFRRNIARACNYGFWLGFSRDGLLEGNEIAENRQAGIATENGLNFKVTQNHFRRNRHGVLLWSKHMPAFLKAVPENETRANWEIESNRFVENHIAVRIAPDQDHGIRPHRPAAPLLGAHRIGENVLKRNQTDFDVHGAEGRASL